MERTMDPKQIINEEILKIIPESGNRQAQERNKLYPPD